MRTSAILLLNVAPLPWIVAVLAEAKQTAMVSGNSVVE